MENFNKIKMPETGVSANKENADFVTKIKTEKSEKSICLSANQIVAREMLDDISVFSDEERVVIEKKLIEEESLNNKEQAIFDKARINWFFDKYGFPYKLKITRNETLLRKYASEKEVEEKVSLQQELFLAIKADDNEKIKALKEKYESEYPDQLEGIAVLFGLQDYFSNSKKLEELKGKKWKEEEKKVMTDPSEFQFLLTHFISINGHNKEFLRTFWEVLEKTAETGGNLKQLHIMRQSILGQVAALKIFEAIGAKPKLSHPGEDVFKSIDMWSKNEDAIQIKSNRKITEPMMTETDTAFFPGVITEDDEERCHYNSKYFADNQRFGLNLKKYGKIIGKKLRGYFLVVPTAQFDFITGEPSEKIIEFVRDYTNKTKEKE